VSKIGICTVTYNQRGCAPDVVSNLGELDADDCAFFVRDDCSTDGTFEYFQASKLQNLNLQRNAERMGARKNSIALYKSVDTEYMMCKGGDDLVYPPAVRKALSILARENPDVIICKAAYVGFQIALELSKTKNLTNVIKDSAVKNKIVFDRSWQSIEDLLAASATLPGMLWNQGLLIRTEVAQEAGFLPAGEVDDWGHLHNLALLARQKKLKVFYLNEILTIIGQVSDSLGSDPMRQMCRQLYAIENFWHDDFKKHAFCNALLKKLSNFAASDVSYNQIRTSLINSLDTNKYYSE